MMKHRVLSMLLALVMVVSLLPVAALANEPEESTDSSKVVTEADIVPDTCDDNLAVLFTEGNTTYYLGVGDINGGEEYLYGPRGSCELSSDTDSCGFAFSAQVFTRDGDKYIPVSDAKRSELKEKYYFVLEICPKASCIGHYYPRKGEDGIYRFTAESLGDWIIRAFAREKTQERGVVYNAQLTVSMRRTLEEGVLGISNGGDFSKTLELTEGEHNNIMLAVGRVRLDNNDVIAANNTPAEGKLTFSGAVKAIEHASGPWWKITLEASEEGNSTGWIQYGTDVNNCVTITVRPAPKPSGRLEVGYNSPFASELTLWAGAYDVELRLSGDNEIWWLNDAKYADQLRVDGDIIKSIEQHSFKDEEGNDVFMWTISVAEPSGGETTGWIQYGTEENNRVTITVLPSRGDKVGENNRIVQGSDEFDWASWGTVMPFEWNGQTYYLGTAALSTKKPYAQGGRGVEEDEDYYAASVFSLMSGEAGSMSATYQLREDIRAAMMQDGYTFELTLVPTDIGCTYYPAIRTVEMSIEQQGDGTTVAFTSEWQGQKFSKDSVGVWVYDARIYKNGEQIQRNLSNCKYSYNINRTVKLTGTDVAQINTEIEQQIDAVNAQIKAEIGENFGKNDDGLYNSVITLILPAGDLEGQIVIPITDAIVTVYGNNYGQGRIATTLKGGIRFNNNNTNHVGFIHFIGKGKNVEWADEGNRIPNEAVYGIGQGAPEICIFEGYNIAIHSTVRPSWGSQDSIYINNKVAICQNSEDGGQTIMRNNWFIGNEIAVMLKQSVSVDALMNFRNRFINNRTDFGNESGKVLWVSQNFFYHGSWNPGKSDLWRVEDGVICLNFNGEGQLIVPSTPVYLKTENYKNDYQSYKAFLPRFDGFSPTYAYPVATSQFCAEMFYPNRRDPDYCPQWWSSYDLNYPSYVQQGVTISENELDGLRFSSYDSNEDVVTATFDFGASTDGAEN